MIGEMDREEKSVFFTLIHIPIGMLLVYIEVGSHDKRR